MKKITLLFSSVLLIFCAFIGFRYSYVLTEDGGTVQLIFAMSMLDATSREYVKVDETIFVNRYISKNKEGMKHDIVKKVLSDLGWSYETQEGASLFFKKDKESIVVETTLFTENYFLWDVPNEAFE